MVGVQGVVGYRGSGGQGVVGSGDRVLRMAAIKVVGSKGRE